MNKAFGIDMDAWAALNAIGAVVGAIGTVGAVIVALRLARRDYYPRLNVTNAVMQTVNLGSMGSPLELVTITGTNVGHTTITVKGVFWTFGWLRKQMFVMDPSGPLSKPLPKEGIYIHCYTGFSTL